MLRILFSVAFAVLYASLCVSCVSTKVTSNHSDALERSRLSIDIRSIKDTLVDEEPIVLLVTMTNHTKKKITIKDSSYAFENGCTWNPWEININNGVFYKEDNFQYYTAFPTRFPFSLWNRLQLKYISISAKSQLDFKICIRLDSLSYYLTPTDNIYNEYTFKIKYHDTKNSKFGAFKDSIASNPVKVYYMPAKRDTVEL